MATTCSFVCPDSGPNGMGGLLTADISLGDVVVQTVPTAVGTFSTATVTADVQRRIFVNAADAAANNLRSGWYEKVAAATFRMQD